MFSPEKNTLLVSRAETPGCVYDITHPDKDIKSGELLELVDFHNSAQNIGSVAALGTRVFKEAVLAVNDAMIEDPSIEVHDPLKDPFEHIWRLPGSPAGLTIWITYPNIRLRLQDYYIRTQALKDYYDELSEQQRLKVFARKGSIVVRDVIYDLGQT